MPALLLWSMHHAARMRQLDCIEIFILWKWILGRHGQTLFARADGIKLRFIIGGPNGAGKPTTVPALLKGTPGVAELQ